MVNYRAIIQINSEIRSGKPCVRNTRISVFDVLNWLANGMTFDEIIDDFPELTSEDISACLAYASDRERKLSHAS
ncbi:MAG: DUF433 domain-containing protein [Crocinitomicaceae bacterium]|jgi:uncharacterized protein (DUF433 family)